jgi:acyl-CoA thioesterase-1
MFKKNFHKFLIFCLFIVGSFLITVTSHERELKLLAFGDSLIAGYGLPKKDGFVDQLEAVFNEAGTRLKVINAGVSGDTSAGGLSRIDWALGANPDAILLELGANSFW